MSNKETKKARPLISGVRGPARVLLSWLSVWFMSALIGFILISCFPCFPWVPGWNQNLSIHSGTQVILILTPKNQYSEKLISKEREEELRAILGPVPGCCFGLPHCLAHQMRVCTQSVCAEPDSPLQLAPQMLGSWAASSLQVRPLGSWKRP